MKDCGIDFVIDESDALKVNLCFEIRGGPVCGNTIMWDKPLCVQWRKKNTANSMLSLGNKL